MVVPSQAELVSELVSPPSDIWSWHPPPRTLPVPSIRPLQRCAQPSLDGSSSAPKAPGEASTSRAIQGGVPQPRDPRVLPGAQPSGLPRCCPLLPQSKESLARGQVCATRQSAPFSQACLEQWGPRCASRSLSLSARGFVRPGNWSRISWDQVSRAGVRLPFAPPTALGSSPTAAGVLGQGQEHRRRGAGPGPAPTEHPQPLL